MLTSISDANPNLKGIIDTVRWNEPAPDGSGGKKLHSDVLSSLVNYLDPVDLSNRNATVDILGDAYEYLIKRFADENKGGTTAGQFYTPQEVVDVIVRYLKPQKGEQLYDPTCGSGGFLINAAKFVKSTTGSAKNIRLFGQDAHFKTYLRARSLTPYIDKAIIDDLASCKARTCFGVPTAPLYQGLGYTCHIVFELSQFDTDEKYKQYQDIGHWINQSFFIELKCILDTFITDWNQCPLKDEKHFELLRKCRHLFAHSSYKLDYTPRKGHEHDYEQAYSLYNEVFGQATMANKELNLSIDEFE